MGKLDGQVAVVFGAGAAKAGGMSNGKACTLTYARAGARVVAVDRNLAAAEETAAVVREEGYECLPLQADVAVSSEVEEAVARVIAAYGAIDVLHNNAGIIEFSSLIETSEEEWDRILSVNVKGMFLTCRAVVPHMVSRQRGSIVNISALASVRFLGPVVSYTTSKAAVNGLTQAIAIEFASAGIRCNAILPGFIDTPAGLSIYERGDPAETERRLEYRNARLPGGKGGECWDVANAALFLASDDSRYLNGVLLPVEAGVMLLAPTAV